MTDRPEPFVKLPHRALRLLPELKGAAIAVLVVLCGARDFRTDTVSVGKEWLCTATGISDTRYITEAIARLERHGLIRTLRASVPGCRGRAVWLIVYEAADDTVDPPNETPALERGSHVGDSTETPAQERGRRDGVDGQTPARTPARIPAQRRDVSDPESGISAAARLAGPAGGDGGAGRANDDPREMVGGGGKLVVAGLPRGGGGGERIDGEDKQPAVGRILHAQPGRGGGVLPAPPHQQDHAPGRAPAEAETPSELKIPPGLAALWNASPGTARVRSSRKDCLDVWRRLKLEAKAAAVLASLEGWKRSPQWRRDNGQYVPALHRWLSRRKFEESPNPTQPTPPAPTAAQLSERGRQLAASLTGVRT